MPQPIVEIPCISLKPAKPLKISLPFGGFELRSITNIADGPPTDCSLAHSLLLQITPMLGSMACLLKVLKVVSALKATAESGFIKAGDLITAIGDMADCLKIVLGPIPICTMVKDILLLIIAYLSCVIQAADSILHAQIGIDLNAAQGNPVLLASMKCAQENTQTALSGVTDAMVGLQPIIEMVNMALSIVDQDPIALPPLAMATPTAASLLEEDPLKPARDIIETLKTIAQALPC
jgi:hypothetical protein